MKTKRNQGFTLIELLIVVAILALLAAIAVPSYRDYVLRSGRTEAIKALSELSNLQEEFYSNQLAYTSTISLLGYSATTPNDLYQLSVAANTSTRYTIQAIAINDQLQDDTCRRFTLNGFGERGAVDTSSDDTTNQCWNR